MDKDIFLSVVIPIFNEAETLPELYERLHLVIEKITSSYELIFVNDGSYDSSFDILFNFHKKNPKVKIINLSRNFGHQASYTAGLQYAKGSGVILMDGDLQDPPEVIPFLVKKWQEGYEVVLAKRRKRKESFLRRFIFKMFYRILNFLSAVRLPLDVGMFSLLDAKVVKILKHLPERNRYIPGLRAWVGFSQTYIEYEREERKYSVPRQTWGRLWRLAMDAVFSFSYIPLRISIWVGFIMVFVSLIIGIYVIYEKLVSGRAILGWASIMLSILFISGVIIFMLGIAGEYIARIYEEIKARPIYIIDEVIGFGD